MLENPANNTSYRNMEIQKKYGLEKLLQQA